MGPFPRILPNRWRKTAVEWAPLVSTTLLSTGIPPDLGEITQTSKLIWGITWSLLCCWCWWCPTHATLDQPIWSGHSADHFLAKSWKFKKVVGEFSGGYWDILRYIEHLMAWVLSEPPHLHSQLLKCSPQAVDEDQDTQDGNGSVGDQIHDRHGLLGSATQLVVEENWKPNVVANAKDRREHPDDLRW